MGHIYLYINKAPATFSATPRGVSRKDRHQRTGTTRSPPPPYMSRPAALLTIAIVCHA